MAAPDAAADDALAQSLQRVAGREVLARGDVVVGDAEVGISQMRCGVRAQLGCREALAARDGVQPVRHALEEAVAHRAAAIGRIQDGQQRRLTPYDSRHCC